MVPPRANDGMDEWYVNGRSSTLGLGATVSSPGPDIHPETGGSNWPDSRQRAGRSSEYPRQIPLLPTGYFTAVRRLGANIRRYITLAL